MEIWLSLFDQKNKILKLLEWLFRILINFMADINTYDYRKSLALNLVPNDCNANKCLL